MQAVPDNQPQMVYMLPEWCVANTAFKGGKIVLRLPEVDGDRVVNHDFTVLIPALDSPAGMELVPEEVAGADEADIDPPAEVEADDDLAYPVEYGGGD